MSEIPQENELLDVPFGVAREIFEEVQTLKSAQRFSLSELDPEFADTLEVVLEECQKKGYKMVPYDGIRHPVIQGGYWRRSRSSATVQKKISDLRAAGADFLASAIDDAGPQNGNWATNAIPGYSWHQWGEGVDCYWEKNGKVEWDDLEGYRVYAAIAEENGLISLGSIGDWVHVQKRGGSIGSIYSLSEINAEMEKRFAT